eukprot:comp20753_c0_seq1/m.27200 comp20753_c0_seq1/g.27200  ORF comp20753_c0_seq1/g.27200 comp20753_c0_seq1/m.27200 type:complete len:872 (-) comp20753_c0_seq1:715-3330(-)
MNAILSILAACAALSAAAPNGTLTSSPSDFSNSATTQSVSSANPAAFFVLETPAGITQATIKPTQTLTATQTATVTPQPALSPTDTRSSYLSSPISTTTTPTNTQSQSSPPTISNSSSQPPSLSVVPTPTPTATVSVSLPQAAPSNLVGVNGNKVFLGLKTLVVYSAAEDLQLVKTVLDAHGTPYETAFQQAANLTSPIYHAIIVTDYRIKFQPLRVYAQKFGARIVCLHCPSPIEELYAKANTTANGFGSIAFDKSGNAQAIADVMNTGNSFQLVPNVHVPTCFDILPEGVSDGRVIPFLRYGSVSDAIPGPVAAFTTRTKWETEEMHFGFRAWANELFAGDWATNQKVFKDVMQGDFTKLSLALGNVWFQWATRGVYLGQRRMYLTPQVDDLFLPTDLWVGYRYRMTPTDVNYHASWTSNLTSKFGLAPGSNFKLELAFNGYGYSIGKYDNGELSKATDAQISSFNWVSHTFTHRHLDYMDKEQCNNTDNVCPVSPERLSLEITLNNKAAMGEPIPSFPMGGVYPYGLNGSPGGGMFYGKEWLAANIYSPKSLVTPEISGLYPRGFKRSDWNGAGRPPRPGNFEAMQAIYKAGIRYVVGQDNRRELVSKVSPYHGVLMTQAEYGVDDILIIPRMTTSVSYFSSTVQEWLDFYNKDASCRWDIGPPCVSPMSADAAMQRITQKAIYNQLMYRADPHMFHQANMRYLPEGRSLISWWIDSVIQETVKYVNKMPIQSPPMDSLGQKLKNRMARDYCGLQGIVSVTKGQWGAISISGTSSCNALLTVRNGSPIEIADQTLAVESYGPDKTYTILVAATAKNVDIISSEPTTLPTATANIIPPEIRDSAGSRMSGPNVFAVAVSLLAVFVANAL